MMREAGSVPTAFDEEQRRLSFPAGIEYYFWHVARVQILYDKLRPLRPDDLVLDIGCGPGVEVRGLRARGIDCIGCDPAPYDRVLAREDADGNPLFYERDAFELPEEVTERVRIVLLLDVLEHLAEPASFLRRCRERFPSLRQVLMTMPARQELWSNYDEVFGHHQRYDRLSASALCVRSGLVVETTGYFFHGLYLPMALAKLLRGEREVVVRPIKWRRVHQALGTMFYLEEKLIPSFVAGTSIYARARVDALEDF